MYKILIPYRQKKLTSWLELIPNLEQTIENHYQPEAILMNVKSQYSVYQRVIKAVTQLQDKLPIALYPKGPNEVDSLQDINLMSSYFITLVLIYINTCRHTYRHTYIHTHMHTYIHTHIHIYICT